MISWSGWTTESVSSEGNHAKRCLTEQPLVAADYDPEEQEIDTTVRGWTHACAPESPAKHFDRFAPITKSKHSKSLVADHYATFDLCQHPNALSLHGVTSGKNPHVQPRLSPVFSLSKTSLHTDVLGVPVEQWTDSMPNAPAWRNKKDDRLMWRGSNTGTYHSQGTPWRVSHRTRLVGMAGWEASGDVDLMGPPTEGDARSIKETMLRAPAQTLNKGTLDIAFSGVPIREYSVRGRLCSFGSFAPWLCRMRSRGRHMCRHRRGVRL